MNEASVKLCPVMNMEECRENNCALWCVGTNSMPGCCAVRMIGERLDDMMIDGLPVEI